MDIIDVSKEGLEQYGRFYSDYEGKVTNYEKLNKLILYVKCPTISNISLVCKPKSLFGGKDYGFFAIPQIGEMVKISFEYGDIRFPQWSYGSVSKEQTPNEVRPDTIVLKSPGGNLFMIDDKNQTITLMNKANFILQNNQDGIFMGNNSYNLRQLFDDLVEWLQNSQVLTPSGNGKFSPDSLVDLLQIKNKYETIITKTQK